MSTSTSHNTVSSNNFRRNDNRQQQQQKSRCRFCNQAIRWTDDPTGATRDDGTPKRVPLNAYPPFDRHRCSQFAGQAGKYKNMPNRDKSKGVACRSCGAPIMFSEDQKSKSGKFIPLEMDSSTPHSCPNRPQYNNQQQPRKQPEELGESEF